MQMIAIMQNCHLPALPCLCIDKVQHIDAGYLWSSKYFLPETHQAEQEVQAGYWAVLIVVGLKSHFAFDAPSAHHTIYLLH